MVENWSTICLSPIMQKNVFITTEPSQIKSITGGGLACITFRLFSVECRGWSRGQFHCEQGTRFLLWELLAWIMLIYLHCCWTRKQVMTVSSITKYIGTCICIILSYAFFRSTISVVVPLWWLQSNPATMSKSNPAIRWEYHYIRSHWIR